MLHNANFFSYAHFSSNVYKSHALLKQHISINHMSSNSNIFVSMTKFSHPRRIRLPNESNLPVSHYGDVQLHKSILLHNVLYVPSFRFNIVSIIKLTSQLHTFVLFTDETCIMHDPLLKNRISLGVVRKRINDVYVFDYDHLKHNLSYTLYVSLISFLHHVYVSHSNIMMWHKLMIWSCFFRYIETYYVSS